METGELIEKSPFFSLDLSDKILLGLLQLLQLACFEFFNDTKQIVIGLTNAGLLLFNGDKVFTVIKVARMFF